MHCLHMQTVTITSTSVMLMREDVCLKISGICYKNLKCVVQLIILGQSLKDRLFLSEISRVKTKQ